MKMLSAVVPFAVLVMKMGSALLFNKRNIFCNAIIFFLGAAANVLERRSYTSGQRVLHRHRSAHLYNRIVRGGCCNCKKDPAKCAKLMVAKTAEPAQNTNNSKPTRHACVLVPTATVFLQGMQMPRIIAKDIALKSRTESCP